MRVHITLRPALVCAGLAMLAQAAFGAATNPVPRTDINSQVAHLDLIEKAKKGGVDAYFIGDSITRRWGTKDKSYAQFYENWKSNFFGWNAGDFGWGADGIENILWRLQHEELDGVNPKVIVVLAGINNVGSFPGGPGKIDDISGGIKMIKDICREKAPNATIVLMGIFPSNVNMAVIPVINAINENIAKMADGKTVRYLNINDKIADAEGKYLTGYVNSDKLHPTVKTYQVWADALKPIFTELLGPPAATDHAPPPTGDPRANGDPRVPKETPRGNRPNRPPGAPAAPADTAPTNAPNPVNNAAN